MLQPAATDLALSDKSGRAAPDSSPTKHGGAFCHLMNRYASSRLHERRVVLEVLLQEGKGRQIQVLRDVED